MKIKNYDIESKIVNHLNKLFFLKIIIIIYENLFFLKNYNDDLWKNYNINYIYVILLTLILKYEYMKKGL